MVKYDFSTNEARYKCNTHFHIILSGQSISENIIFISSIEFVLLNRF